MAVIQHRVVIFRKSTNTNSFGLRGYWAIEKAPTDRECDNQGQHRVWEFATSNDLQRGEQHLEFVTDHNGKPHYPCFELPTLKGSLPPYRFEAFLAEFNL